MARVDLGGWDDLRTQLAVIRATVQPSWATSNSRVQRTASARSARIAADDAQGRYTDGCAM